MLALNSPLLLILFVSSGWCLPYAKIGFQKKYARDSKDPLFRLLNNKDLYYLVDLEIGSPPQKVQVMLDTGLSDLVVNSVTNPLCQPINNSAQILQENLKAGLEPKTTLHKRKNVLRTVVPGPQNKAVMLDNSIPVQQVNCFENGFFAGNLSLTFNLNSTELSITYGDGTMVNGHYGTDHISVGGLDLKNLSFGLIEMGNSGLGVLGLSIPKLESTYARSGLEYANFPQVVAQELGLKDVVYSLNLDRDHDDGAIIFGAVDKSQYVNSFQRVSYGPYKNQHGFYVDVDSISLYYEGKPTKNISLAKPLAIPANLKFRKSLQKIPALVDSGSTLNQFPEDIYALIQTYVPHSSISSSGLMVDCDILEDPNNFIRYTFGCLDIDVPFAEFNVTTGASGGQCMFGMSSVNGRATLGDPFLRKSYLVFDLTKSEIAIAAAADNSGPEQLVSYDSI